MLSGLGWKLAGIILCVGILSACATSDSDQADSPLQLTAENLIENPRLTPEFILKLYPEGKVRFSPSAVCVDLSQEFFWKPGYYADELLEHLRSTMRFSLDEHIISEADMRIAMPPEANPIFDEHDNIVGSYGFPLNICTRTGYLKSGPHVGTFEVTDLSGQKYSYTWAFWTGDELEPLPTIIVIPIPAPTDTKSVQ